jgi:hypothetical protein
MIAAVLLSKGMGGKIDRPLVDEPGLWVSPNEWGRG